MGKIFIFKRQIFTGFFCLLAAAAMFAVVNTPSIVGVAATARQLPIYRVQRDQKMVSLTFDAAWGDVRVRQQSSS